MGFKPASSYSQLSLNHANVKRKTKKKLHTYFLSRTFVMDNFGKFSRVLKQEDSLSKIDYNILFPRLWGF